MKFFWDELGDRGPDTALVDADGARLSYADLAGEADRFAATLGSRRMLLLLEMENHSSAVIAFMGALRARVPVVLVPPGDAPGTGRIVDAFAPELRWSRTGGLVELAAPRGNLHEDLALALSTSGTTGTTKLVRLSALAIDSNARSIAEYLGLTPSERPITSLPASYCYGMSVINSHLAVGASIVLTEASVVDDTFWELIERHGATSFAGVPYTYELLERTRFVSSPPRTLRSFTQAGGRLAVERVERFGRLARERGQKFFVMYGQTEAAPRISYLPPEELPAHPDCIGRAIPGGRLELVDPETGAAAAGRGELVYRGPNVMMGYATAREDLGRGPELDALRTGDLAEEVEPGLFRVVGRMNRFAKLFGLRVSLDDLESQLAAEGHRAFVVSDDRIVAVFIEGSADREAVARTLAARLGLPQTTFSVLTGDRRPVMSSGKTDYPTILRRAQEDRHPAVEARAAERLERGFAELFPGERLSDADTFAGLGGDSLSYVAATIVVEEALGELPDRWEQLTIGELKERARAAAATPVPRSSRTQLEGELVARCLAVAVVVFNHSLLPQRWFGFPLLGGTDVLMLLFGFNVMRFQGTRLLAGRGFDVLKHNFKIFGVPYFALMLLWFLLKWEFDGTKLLLVSNYWHDSSALGILWFFESLLQMTILLALAFSSEAVGRAWRSWVWLPFAVVAVGAIVKVAAWSVHDPAALGHRTPDAMFFLFAAGLALSVYRRAWGGVAIAAVVVLMELLTWGARETHFALMAVCLAIMFIPRMSVPPWLGAATFKVAASAFYIYLVTPVVMYVFVSEAGLKGQHPFLFLFTNFAAGLVLHSVVIRTLAWRSGNRRPPAMVDARGEGAA